MRLNTLSYYADFFISVALILYFAGRVIAEPWRIGLGWVACASLGFFIWTLAEYLTHRWIYHRVPYFKALHDAHHAEPNAFIGAPPLLEIVIILSLVYAPVATISITVATGLTAGVLIGYCGYMLVHHAAHHWSPKPHSWLAHARQHHAQHHYLSENANFGVTTSFWDRVFSTGVQVRQRPATQRNPAPANP